MSKFQIKVWVAIVVFFLVGGISLTAQARNPLNVTLTHFGLGYVANGIEVSWETETEFGISGYKLQRGQNGSFAFLQNPSGGGDLFVPAIGDVTTGGIYSFVDETAVVGETYTYVLYEVTTNGDILRVATATIPNTIYLPIIIK